MVHTKMFIFDYFMVANNITDMAVIGFLVIDIIVKVNYEVIVYKEVIRYICDNHS